MFRECGAKTKTNFGKFCRQPAMANGRCRLHGGKSTGPKTLEGCQSITFANTKHGFYAKAEILKRKSLQLLIKNAKEGLNQ